MTLSIFCDGGARGNPGPAAIGFVIKDQPRHLLHQHHQYIGQATNNIAEYQAVVSALQWLNKNKSQLQITNCQFFLDSALVVNQLNGKFKIKSANLRQLVLKVKILEQELKVPTYYHSIPRSQNSQADALVNQALDSHGF